MMKQFEEMIKNSPRINNTQIINWLYVHNYFDAPASKGHHLACPGGLVRHSIGVANELMTLTDKLNLHWEQEDSPLIVGLFHDLCKMDQYNSTNNGYEWNKNQSITGHGDKSVMLLSTLMRLTEEEMYCIRYHMGAFSDSAEERSAYSNACKMYPNVLYTHTADMISSQLNDC